MVLVDMGGNSSCRKGLHAAFDVELVTLSGTIWYRRQHQQTPPPTIVAATLATNTASLPRVAAIITATIRRESLGAGRVHLRVLVLGEESIEVSGVDKRMVSVDTTARRCILDPISSSGWRRKIEPLIERLATLGYRQSQALRLSACFGDLGLNRIVFSGALGSREKTPRLEPKSDTWASHAPRNVGQPRFGGSRLQHASSGNGLSNKNKYHTVRKPFELLS